MNIAEIAKLAGVSNAAVSRFFNNGYISEEKREAIAKVVEETGYRPSVQAQTLRTRKTKMIGVIVPRVASEPIGSVVEGILSVLNKSGYQMLLAVTQNDPEKELEYLTAFNEKQVDGVILAATVFSSDHKTVLKNMTVPVVIAGQHFQGYCSVYHDDYHSVYEMTKRFLQQGRRRLGYVSAFWQDKAAGAQRYRGYCDAVKDMGEEELSGNYVIARFSMESGYEKTGELLKKCGPLDGIICASDEMAIGAVNYLREKGIQVPEQVMVAGHGDSALARVIVPPLPTVHYFYEKSGEIAVRMLLENLDGKEDQTVQEVKLGYYITENRK